MQIEIDERIAQQVQGLTTIQLKGRDYSYFAEWLIRVGLATVRAALREHPELTIGDLAMMQYRNHEHH